MVKFIAPHIKKGDVCVLRGTGEGIRAGVKDGMQALKILTADKLAWVGCFTYVGESNATTH